MTKSSQARAEANHSGKTRPFLVLIAALALLAIGLGWWWQSREGGGLPGSGKPDAAQLEQSLSAAGITPRERAAIESLIRAYILEHPEIIPEAVQALQEKETLAQIGPLRGALETPFPGAVMGNPQGKVTLVEFTDFACTYCRKSVADLEALIAANPDLKVVVRELPIISPNSAAAARMALAAAAQGKFAAFHKAMFAQSSVSPATIDAAAQAAGLDLAAAKAFAAKPETEAELARNVEIARRLGVNGTPGWLVGDQLIAGAVGKERLQEAIEAARKRS